jgi:hypothetical protein
MGCDRRTFVRASLAATGAAAGTAGVSAARAQENESGDGNATGGNETQTGNATGGNTTGGNETQAGNETQTGNGTGGNGTQAGNGTLAGNGTGAEGGGEGGESGGAAVNTQSLTLMFAAAVMAALSPLVFGVLLLLGGRDGGDGGEGGSTGGRRFDAP